MRKNTHDGLAALAALRSRLNTSSSLEVIHENGYCWKGHFTFNAPARTEDLEEIKKHLWAPLP